MDAHFFPLPLRFAFMISHIAARQGKKKLDEVALKPVWDVPENPQH